MVGRLPEASPMKRTIFGSLFLGALLVAGAYWSAQPVAQAENFVQDVSTGGGNNTRLLRIGIPGGGKLGDILRKNAKLSGGFEVLDRKSMPAALAKATTFDKSGWDSLGADVVILADASGPQIKFRMYEIGKGTKPVLSKGYPKGNELAAADKFMNDVVAHFTGKRGPFGSRIAFVRTRRNPTLSKNIQSVEMNGEAAKSVTANRSLNILPSVGPGGVVLFTSYAKRNPDLWKSSGGAPVRISKYPGLNLGGAMSPDGGSIAVALSKDGNAEIYKLDKAGNVKSRLTKNAAIDGSPSWSPGGQIAFVSSRAGGPQVFRMSGSGGSASRVTKNGSYNQSPDWCQAEGCGQWIVYSGRDSSNRYDVYKIDVKSGTRKRLTQSSGRNLDPSWSPDGRLVSYYKDGNIYVANEDGNNQIEIARGATTPDWGPMPAGY